MLGAVSTVYVLVFWTTLAGDIETVTLKSPSSAPLYEADAELVNSFSVPSAVNLTGSVTVTVYFSLNLGSKSEAEANLSSNSCVTAISNVAVPPSKVVSTTG